VEIHHRAHTAIDCGDVPNRAQMERVPNRDGEKSRKNFSSRLGEYEYFHTAGKLHYYYYYYYYYHSRGEQT